MEDLCQRGGENLIAWLERGIEVLCTIWRPTMELCPEYYDSMQRTFKLLNSEPRYLENGERNS